MDSLQNSAFENYQKPSPTKSIYELIKHDINVPDGLLFRGKYVAKTRNQIPQEKSRTDSKIPNDMKAYLNGRVNS